MGPSSQPQVSTPAGETRVAYLAPGQAPASGPRAPSRDASIAAEGAEAPARVLSAAPPRLATYLNPLAMIAHLHTHRDLIWRFALRDVQGRYKGSYLGIFWSFVTPLLMLAVYTFVFGFVLGTRWTGFAGGALGFSLPLFAGLIVFGVLSECLSKAPGLIVGNPNYVKKVVFPLELLPVALLLASLVHAGISTLILLAGQALFLGQLSGTLLWFPLVVAALGMLTLGGTWLLASLGVFIRDIGPAVSIALIVDDARRTLVFGQPPHWVRLGLVAVASAVAMQLGYVWFMRSKRWFADVI